MALKVRYESFSRTGRPVFAAFMEFGKFGFAGHGNSYAEAHAELLHRVRAHLVDVEHAVGIVADSRPPAEEAPSPTSEP